MEDCSKSKKYHRIKTLLFFVNLFTMVIFLFLFFYLGTSAALASFLKKLLANAFFAKILYFSIFFATLSTIKLIFSFIEDYLVEKKFGLSHETIASWGKDFVKEFFIEYLVFVILVYALYVFLRTPTWWLKMWGVWFFINFILAKISPYVILPLFFKFMPLDDEELKIKIKRLARHFSVIIDKMWVVDFSRKTKKANAFVTGLGESKRVALADNLIANYTPQEIEVVVAHEFAHVRNKDTLKILILLGGGSFLVFFLVSVFVSNVFGLFALEVYNIAGLPLFLLLSYAFAILGLPLYNGVLRVMEVRADSLALGAIESSESFISLFEKLAKNNLAEINPPLWKEVIFYNHPAIGRRIEMAKNYEKET